jgi:hypothetical protein
MWSQLAHLALGFAIPATAITGHYWATAYLICLVREHAQMQQKKRDLGHPWDWGRGRTVDLIFWTLGGLVLSIWRWIA